MVPSLGTCREPLPPACSFSVVLGLRKMMPASKLDAGKSALAVMFMLRYKDDLPIAKVNVDDRAVLAAE